MSALVTALQTLDLDGEISLGGRRVTLRGECCRVHGLEATWGESYYTWCEAPGDRTVVAHDNAMTAIHAGLRRAARPRSAERRDIAGSQQPDRERGTEL